MSWVEARDALESGFHTVVFAVGSNEQHGPHLPTSTDSLVGEMLARKVAGKLGNSLQAPTMNVGCSEHHMGFPGTISLKPETLKALVRDYCISLAKHGFRNIVILPSHGGNFEAVREVVSELDQNLRDTKVIAYTDLDGLLNFLHEASSHHGIPAGESGAHAGESETSMVLAIRKDLVNMERAKEGFVGRIDDRIHHVLSQGIKTLTEIGVIGDPRKAEAEKGEEYLELWAEKMASYIRKHAVN
ncbi:MAG: creatininase family protein [Candidatus Bathyarchaeota archaeon]|nr:MAG: creatininase family protein [Candidatus Bathyarchaeota archaeon]